jgi:hypothetical protein
MVWDRFDIGMRSRDLVLITDTEDRERFVGIDCAEFIG